MEREAVIKLRGSLAGCLADSDAKRGKQALQMYEVSIQPNAVLAPGRHDTTIELSAGGTPDRFVTVPVVVEVEGLHF